MTAAAIATAQPQALRAQPVPRTPWLRSAPALALFGCLLLVPHLLTAVLSFQVFDPSNTRRDHLGGLVSPKLDWSFSPQPQLTAASSHA